MSHKFFALDHKKRQWSIGSPKEEELKEKNGRLNFKVKVEGDLTDAFILTLITFATGGEETPAEIKGSAAATLDFIADNLTDLKINLKRAEAGRFSADYSYTVKEGATVTPDDIAPFFENPAAMLCFKLIASGAISKAPQRPGGPIQMSDKMHKTRIAKKEGAGITVKYLEPDIKLTPEEGKFERALLTLLRETSNLNRESPDYYTGNGLTTTAPAQVWDSDNQTQTQTELKQPAIACTWADLFKAYTGKPAHEISGKERQLIRGLTQRFQTILKPILWKQEIPGTKTGTKKYKVLRIEEPLLKRASAADLTAGELEEVEAGGNMPEDKETLYIWLHPAYIAGITEGAVKWPADYDTRISAAIGKGRKETSHGARLRDYLNGVRCGGKNITELGFAAAVAHCGLERIHKKQGAKKAKAEIIKELSICKKIGLVKEYQEAKAAGGEPKFVITLNPEFAK